jgi:L-iditol 2-dehydrogenase
MKALLKTETGVKVDKTEKPTIKDEQDVVIRVAVSGLCRTDIYVAQGLVPAAHSRMIIGHEFAGLVESIGSAVGNVVAGDRVAVMPILPISNDFVDGPDYSHSTMLGVDHDGSFCEYIRVPASSVYKIPNNISFKQGAYMEPIAASLAVLNADITPDQIGVIYGDNRISRLTERIMNAKGYNNVTVYDHSQHEADPLEDNSYDYIIETLATTETMKEMIRAVRPCGRIVLKSRQHVPVAFDVSKLVKKDITLQAVNYGSFQESIDLVASGKLAVDDLFGDVYPIEEFEKVFDISNQREAKKTILFCHE